jgi:hypothetical protein
MRTNLYVKEPEKRHWLAVRKNAGRTIDPETAEIDWRFALVADPYGLDDDLPDELKCVGRTYFVRSHDSDIWVCIHDLPARAQAAIVERWDKQEAMMLSCTGGTSLVDREWFTGEHDQQLEPDQQSGRRRASYRPPRTAPSTTSTTATGAN